MTLATTLASFVAETTPASLPSEVAGSVRARILDTIGVALGALDLDTSRAAIEHATALGGAPHASMLGSPARVPAPMAAFVNGVLAHSLDYDDTHLPSIVHPSASIVPAVLAAGQLAGASGAEVVAAAATGIEACVRLGMAGYSPEAGSKFFERGQHATSICGAVAGAAASARLLGADAAGIRDAIGIAASMGSGLLEANRAGGTVKRLHCGIAARSAVEAAMLAVRGFTGPPSVLEGRFGFFHAWIGGEFDETPLREIGSRWELPGIFFKPYPCNHFTHAGIDAAIALRQAGVTADDVSSIDLGVASQTVRTIGEPIDQKQAPDTGYLAKFSGPYTVAAALLGGGGLGLGLDDFTDEQARDPSRRALMAKITVSADPGCDAIYPHQFPAVLRVKLADGDELVESRMDNRGGPARPLTDEELRVKFRDCASRALDDAAIAAIEAAAGALLDAPAIDALLEPTGRLR